MLETAMIIIVFLTLLGAVFDLGVALYQYSMLRHTTNMAVRDLTVALSSTNFAGRGCALFGDVTEKYLTETTRPSMTVGGTNAALVTWKYNMRAGSGPLRSLRLRLDIPVNCFFLCRFFGNAWHLHSDAVTTMDSSTVPSCCMTAECPPMAP